MINTYMPVRLHAGKDCLELNKEEIRGLGKSCYIVTGLFSAKKSGALATVQGVLDQLGITYQTDNSIRENPLLETCRVAGIKANEMGAGFIIGIGGGSPMDAAKAVSVFAANPNLDEAAFYDKEWASKPLPVMVVGTTAGTGSEVTDVAVLTDSRGRKHSIHDPALYPVVSFADPVFTVSLPKEVTLSCGLDVLAHAAESYFSKKADTLSRVYSVASIKKLYGPLLRSSLKREVPFEDRETLFEASLLAGMAISTTGTVFPHNMGYYLTERYQVPHGIASAVFLKPLLDYVREEEPDISRQFYKELGIRGGDLIELLRTVLIKPDIHMTEEEIENLLPRYENNNSVKNTVGYVSRDRIRDIFRSEFLN